MARHPSTPGTPQGRAPGDGLPLVTLGTGASDAGGVLALPVRPGAEGKESAERWRADDPDDVAADVPAALRAERATGEPGAVTSVQGDPRWERVVAIGTGSAPTPADLRRAGAALARLAKGSATLTVDLRGTGLDVGPIAEAVLLASYGFALGESAPRALQEVVLVVDDRAAGAAALSRAVTTARATAAARDLVNTPSATKTPAWLADRAVQLLDGLRVRVRDERALAAEGFGGILGVGQGSSRPPRLVEASYDGGSGPHVVLVGKGITFDTGGLSLKRGDGMVTMKMDMGGGAAVLGALRVAADLRLPLRVTALVAAAENMPSGAAQRPGDVLTQYGGRTVEVLNTDAEGRLVLADALAYADAVLAPDVVVDVATLTGAMPVALGKRTAGLFCSDDALAGRLAAAADRSGERVWRMPLVQDYRAALDSRVADLRNIGDPRRKLQGGSITAALFLREFTGGRPWAHLDIAGPAWSGSDDDELTAGGTGYGVRLLAAFLTELAATPEPAWARTGRRSA